MSVQFQERFAAIRDALATPGTRVWVADPARPEPPILRRWTAAVDDETSTAGLPPAAPVLTRSRSVLDLVEGDVVIDPDGRAHRLDAKYQVDGISVSLTFDTGVHLYKTWGERGDTYDVRTTS